MSHVDEGTIHAWLDGAYDSDDAERARIEAHLESCAECRAAVEVERRVNERAAGILGLVVPDRLTVEPFEKMIASRRGGGGDSGGEVRSAARRRPGYRMPLTLAATVVLAVTATWFAREYLPATRPVGDASFRAIQPQEAPAEADASGQRQDEATAPSTARTLEAAPARNERSASDDRGVAGRASGALTAGALTERESRAAGAAPPPQAAQPAATAPPPEARVGEIRQRTQEETRRLAESVLVRSVAAEKAVVFGDIAAGDNASADSISGGANGRVLALVDSVSWTASDMGRVAALLGGSAAGIADMTPDSVQQATVRGVPIVRLVYRLVDGSAVELLQWPMGAIPDEPRLADRDRQAAEPGRVQAQDAIVRVDRVDFLLRGPVSPDSLAALRARVRRNP